MFTLKAKWDAIYNQVPAIQSKPSAILLENEFLLPKQGSALDLACGLGANALYLAEQGLQVTAWDISEAGLKKLQQAADSKGLTINVQAKAIDSSCLNDCSFDVIVVSRFLDRTLTNAIMAALNPGGLLIYQTYTQIKAKPEGPKNPAFLLAPEELLRMFSALQVIYYRENALLGDLHSGLRNEAQFIGQKK